MGPTEMALSQELLSDKVYDIVRSSILDGTRPPGSRIVESELARTLGVSDRVHFLGFQRDVAAVLSAFDLVVFPSLWEGTPLTSFEALAMGKPIVSTDADGLCEILRDGIDAVVVPKAHARELADAVVALERDPARRAALGAEAQRTSRRYDIAAYVRKMERLYELMARVSTPSKRQGLLREDLSFLDGGAA